MFTKNSTKMLPQKAEPPTTPSDTDGMLGKLLQNLNELTEIHIQEKSNKWKWYAGAAVLALMTYKLIKNLIQQISMITESDKRSFHIDTTAPNVTFSDIVGIDEIKEELADIVEFLKHPEKYTTLVGKLPKGVLLNGPPGAGKTLLAKAVAGEAKVPYLYMSGANFDTVYVGSGALKVRELFAEAKKQSPCIIFIDEIDSVGAQRTSASQFPYANQTINQLRSEMDGFNSNDGVIVLGATNRISDMDQALLRPGRFDLCIEVPLPAIKDRKEIIKYYLSKVTYDINIDVDILGRGTPGFSGADIANMVNQAAIHAARENADFIHRRHLEFARDKILMGPERMSAKPSTEDQKITAIHEAGHAVVSYFTEHALPLHKVTIIPRGSSLGHTAFLPREEAHQKKVQLLGQMDALMGGRAAEDIFLQPDHFTTGAADDLNVATNIAESMVKKYGMSPALGLRTFPERNTEQSKGGNYTHEVIDKEITNLLNESYERAKLLLKNHATDVSNMVDALLKHETLDVDDIKNILGPNKLKAQELKEKANPNKEK